MIATPPRRIVAKFTPLPWQVAPWRDKSPVLLLTGSAGGGKSRLAGEKVHGYLKKYEGATGLIIRKTRESLVNSTLLFMERGVIGIGDDKSVRHFSSLNRFEYANGSVLAYGGMKDKAQREQVRSVGIDGGIDIVWIEEANALEEEDYNEIIPRVRGTATDWNQIILSTNPDGPFHWIKRRLIDAKEASYYFSGAQDNPNNPPDYIGRLDLLTGVQKLRLVKGLWMQAEGVIYDVWLDGPEDGNVTEEADYVEGGGPVLWAIDDGYAGQVDEVTGLFTADSHPRVFLLCQMRPTGILCVFAESYAVRTLSETHIDEVLNMPYPKPDYAAIDRSAAELRGRLQTGKGIYTRNGPPSVEESIKQLRERIAPDENSVRKVLVHPRCKYLRGEMGTYAANKVTGKPIKAHDHGPDALRYLAWVTRYG